MKGQRSTSLPPVLRMCSVLGPRPMCRTEREAGIGGGSGIGSNAALIVLVFLVKSGDGAQVSSCAGAPASTSSCFPTESRLAVRSSAGSPGRRR